MLFDELSELLHSLESDIDTIKKFWQSAGIAEQYNQIKTVSSQEDFWQHPEYIAISKKLSALEELQNQYLHVTTSFDEFKELLILFKDDEAELLKIAPDIRSFIKAAKQFKIRLLLNGEQDNENCFLSINAGAGGTESQDWASILLRMYLRFCERNKLVAHIIDYQAGEAAGIKSATLFVKGTNATGLLKSEEGIHRLVRISPFDANKRRHTSFAALSLAAEVPEVQINIDPTDLRIDTYRAGGAGGQHVNKTESAVRITHIPSGIVVQCQNERSQGQNKETAMKMLKARLAQRAKEEQEAKNAQKEKKKIEWGSQIRSYVLHPYKMVKDHRTETESPQPELVLDGDLMPFIESYLIWSQSN